jgi:heme exporter protein D
MTDWNEFLAMGGYAVYVWPAYAISLFALSALAITSWRWMQRVERLANAGKLAKAPVESGNS